MSERKAEVLMASVIIARSTSFVFNKLGLGTMSAFNLLAVRFLLAFVLLGIVLFPKLRHVNRKTLLWAVPAGLSLTLTYIGATVGLLYTSISNAGFICSLPAVTTPLLTFLVYRKKPERRMLLCLVLCTVGLGLLTLGNDFRPAPGDLICLLCALGYGINLLVVEHAVHQPEVDALQLGVFQQLVTGAAMLVLSLLFETPCLPQTPTGWGSVLFLSVFCTGIAFAITAVQQKHTSAVHVGLIFTLEPLFSAIVAFFFAGERLTPRGYVGAALMMLALVTMEAGLPFLKKKKPVEE